MHHPALSFGKAAKMIGSTPKTLHRWAEEDGVRPVEESGHPALRAADFRKMLAKRDLPTPDDLLPWPRILVADDEADLRKILVFTLQRLWPEGEVRAAANGSEAIEMLAEFKPDLVLTDLKMPGCDGHELAKAVRERRETERTKVLAMTGFDSAEARERFFESGAEEYLRKPIDPQELRESAKRLVGERREANLR